MIRYVTQIANKVGGAKLRVVSDDKCYGGTWFPTIGVAAATPKWCVRVWTVGGAHTIRRRIWGSWLLIPTFSSLKFVFLKNSGNSSVFRCGVPWYSRQFGFLLSATRGGGDGSYV